jgi:pimeloyl-ACP methyl ester carboxylesterase
VELMRQFVLACLGLVLSMPAMAGPRLRAIELPDGPFGGSRQFGNLTLQSCYHGQAFCGQIIRPLDPSGRMPGTIPIVFALFPHTNQSVDASGTIVTQEGGPGAPSIGTRAYYLELYRPMRATRDILMVDARGTGGSGLLRCNKLDRQWIQTPQAVGECGRSLGDTADLYGSGFAVQDMIAVLDALNIGVFDYYGDSYGTFFGQTLAARYPKRLRSVVLDGAYPVIGESPWYASNAAILRFGIAAVCQRDRYCASLPGTATDRVNALLGAVRRRPIAGSAPDGDGQLLNVTADISTVGLILYGGTSWLVNYRDLDAAARALRDNGDTAPLMRLVAENFSADGPSGDFAFSRALYSAVGCMDYQQIYDMGSGLRARVHQRNTAVAAQQLDDPGIEGPLTIHEFEQVSIDTSLLNYCLYWPIRHPPYTPGAPIPKGAHFTEAPTLVMNGELDMLTSWPDGGIVAAQFPHGQQVVIANSFHVDALGDIDNCAQVIVRTFTETLQAGDTSCAAKVKTIRLVPFFPLHASDAIPVVATEGNMAGRPARSLASAAVQTAGDAMARWYVNYSGTDVGLRGGNWSESAHGETTTFTLDGMKWTTDLAVSGTLAWNQLSGAVQANLQFTADDGSTGTVQAAWNDHDSAQPAYVSGTVGGVALAGTMPAP